MHSLIHEHLAHASSRHARGRAERGKPPPGRLRVQAARLLTNLAGRLDAEGRPHHRTRVGGTDW